MSFELSFLIFVGIIFLSEALAALCSSKIPMPLIMGAIFIAAFSTGLLPPDMIKTSNMIAVGTIAFNVLVIHGGTMINVFFIKKHLKSVLVCLGGMLALVVVIGFGMRGILGRDIALLSPGAIIGGGAACAIESRWVLDTRPELSVYPWLIFMFQGLFCVPIVAFALKKEAALLAAQYDPALHRAPPPAAPKSFGLCAKIPARFKKTSYYFLSIMLVAVFNKWLCATFLPGVNLNITALIFGFVLGNIGVLDTAPLFKSDSFGLLMLGLMGLMANTMANNSIYNILRLLPSVLLAFVVACVVLTGLGVLAGRYMGVSKYRGVALTMNCMMGYPVNEMLVENAAKAGKNLEAADYIKAELSPVLACGTMVVSNSVAIVLVSIMAGLVK